MSRWDTAGWAITLQIYWPPTPTTVPFLSFFLLPLCICLSLSRHVWPGCQWMPRVGVCAAQNPPLIWGRRASGDVQQNRPPARVDDTRQVCSLGGTCCLLLRLITSANPTKAPLHYTYVYYVPKYTTSPEEHATTKELDCPCWYIITMIIISSKDMCLAHHVSGLAAPTVLQLGFGSFPFPGLLLAWI